MKGVWKKGIWEKGIWKKAAAASVCCLILAGCGSRAAVGEPILSQGDGTNECYAGGDADASSGTTDGYPAADSLDETMMETTNQFAYRFAQNLTERGENYVFSPYSICSALAVLDNAAGGETKMQIEEMLGIDDLEHYNQQLSYYMGQAQSEDARLTSANSLWIQKDYTLSEKASQYLPLVGHYFDAEVWKADFYGDAFGVKDAVNRWVEEHTGGMIPEFRKMDYDPDTVLSIINAVYFYGEWSTPFEAYNTYDQEFRGERKTTIVDMMHNGEIGLPYYVQGDLRGLSMPYGDGSKVMNILLPSEGASQTAAELFGTLSDGEKNAFLTALMGSEQKIIWSLALPKFQMEYSVPEMAEILKALGMADAFDAGAADFGALADPAATDFHVSDVGHTAKLEVDELGSRASAVTEVCVNETGALLDEEPVTFVVDQPFVFFIQDKETGMILFMGEVKNL